MVTNDETNDETNEPLNYTNPSAIQGLSAEMIANELYCRLTYIKFSVSEELNFAILGVEFVMVLLNNI